MAFGEALFECENVAICLLVIVQIYDILWYLCVKMTGVSCFWMRYSLCGGLLLFPRCSAVSVCLSVFAEFVVFFFVMFVVLCLVSIFLCHLSVSFSGRFSASS